MLLNFKELGDSEARPILALHGLLGSMRNWTSAGRLLAERYRVILIDARNHGGSVHTQTHTFDVWLGTCWNCWITLVWIRLRLLDTVWGGR